MSTLALPGIGTVIVSAAIDSINPCAIGVLILLVSTLAVTHDKWKLFKAGILYIGSVYTVYFLAGLGLMAGFHFIPIYIAQYISIGVAALVVWAGLVEVKDYFWYGKGFSLAIPPEYAKKIHDYMQNVSVPGLVFLGAFVAMVELPCTGGPYLAITLLLSQAFSVQAIMLLAFYNLIFVMPLIIILASVFFGANIADIKMWKHKNRHLMRLAMGLLLIALGWMLMLIAGGYINLA
jgi:cytochrome c biogenesis protein CcdA